MQNSTKNIKRGRGRPPAYDREKSLDAIRDVFWEQGFSGTALDDLVAATGMNRPSLYGAFGDKRSMYATTLARMSSEFAARFDPIFEEEPTIARALKKFYSRAIDQYLSGEQGARGCLFVCTAAAESYTDTDVRKSLGSMIDTLDAMLKNWFTLAQQRGDIAAGCDPGVLAMISSAVLHSIGVRARAGASRKRLQSFVDGWVDRTFT